MPIRRLRVLAAAGLALGLLSLAGCKKIEARGEIKRGNEFFKAGNYASALASYQAAGQLDPGQDKIKKFIGLTYMMMVQPGSKHPKDIEFAAKAMENLQAYVKEHPEDKKANEYLVSMYLQADKFDEAIAFYQQRLQADPKDSKAIQSLAAMYFKKGDFKTGFEWLEKRAAMEPNNPEGWTMIGVQAWDRSYHYPDLDPATRAAIVEKGIEAVDKALKLPGEAGKFDALTYINLLYREKAKMEPDPVKQQDLIATADKYRQQALDLRKKTVATTPTAEPAK